MTTKLEGGGIKAFVGGTKKELFCGFPQEFR